LVQVAYYFIYKDLPSTEYAFELGDQDSSRDLQDPTEFCSFRLKYRKRFQKKICDAEKNPFHRLIRVLFEKRD